ncbi:MAG: hypothetical protein V3S89_07965 [Desulfobacterales bacterium]
MFGSKFKFFVFISMIVAAISMLGCEGDAGVDGIAGVDGEPCTMVDNDDGTFTETCPGGESVTFGETDEPEAYANANGVRGGQLYDKWWTVTGADAPTATHALYPSFAGKSGADTWRCKECHGWDYIGKDGRYRSGSHYTGIEGLYPASNSVWKAYKIIRDDHGYGDAGLADADVWDLVKFYREELFDIDDILNRDGTFTGTAADGLSLFANGISGWDATGKVTNTACATCHGGDGTSDMGTGFEEFPGLLSNDNPQEFQHKVLFGHPGSNPAMPQAAAIHASLWDVADLSAYAQTLPEEHSSEVGDVLAALDMIDSTGFHGISTALNAAAVFADVSTRTQGSVEKALIASEASEWPAELEAKALVFETDTQTLIDALVAEDLAAAQAAGDAIHSSQHDLSHDAYEWMEAREGIASGPEVMAALDIIDSTGFHGISTALNAAAVFADVSTRTQGSVEKALTVSKVVHWPAELAAVALAFETDAQTLIDALVAEDLAASQAVGDAIHSSQHDLSHDAYEWLETQEGEFSGTGAVMAALDIIDSTGFHDISTALNAAAVFADVSTRTQGNVEKALTASKAVAWPIELAVEAAAFETDAQTLIDALAAEDLAAAQAAGGAIHSSQHDLSHEAYEWLEPAAAGVAVSFVSDVYPIFSDRSCTICHDSGHESMDLSGDAPSTYTVVTDTRVDTPTPADSLILTKPLAEIAGGVSHGGGNRFTDTTDVDYQTILTWITEGAADN